MANTYSQTLVHCVFSTKFRKPFIRAELQSAMWSYIGGIGRANNFKALEVGGMPDHMHALVSLPADLTVAKALQLMKGGSSKWFRETHDPAFGWQTGYSSFSVSASAVDKTIAYIRNQAEHHKTRDFQAEYIRLLRLHGIDFDMKYVFD